MFNPMQLMQMMKGGNPQQMLQQLMGNSQLMQNPMAKNAIQMAQKNDIQGIENMAKNLCKEKGLNPDEVMSQIKNQFHL